MEHQKDHSSPRGTNLSCPLLSVVETQKLKIFLAVKIDTTCPMAIILQRVVSPVGIGSKSLIVRRSSNLCQIVELIELELHSLNVNSALHNINTPMFLFLRYFVSLIMEFELQAIRTVELHPLLLRLRKVLPCPIKIPWSFQGLFKLQAQVVVPLWHHYLLATRRA